MSQISRRRSRLRPAKYYSLTTNDQQFMQNKPNLLNAEMNVSEDSTRDYENKTTFEHPKNKPNSNPISKGSTFAALPGWLAIVG